MCRHWITNVLIHKLLLRRVDWTVIEGLAVYGAPLFKLLLHLIRYHLLAEAYLSKLNRTMIVVLALFNNCTTLMTLQLRPVLFVNLIGETVLILTLKGAAHILNFTGLVFCSRLRQLLLLLLLLAVILRTLHNLLLIFATLD